MPEVTEEIITVHSVPLTREKRAKIDTEFEKYHKAVNFVIKAILAKHIATSSKTFELLQKEFATRFDSREQYLRDVIKTARVEIGRHRKMAKVVRTLRDKQPHFKAGRMILSAPIVKIQERVLLLYTDTGEEIPIPFDKPSRNRVIDRLRGLANGQITHGRVRLSLQKAGYITIDIRAQTSMTSSR